MLSFPKARLVGKAAVNLQPQLPTSIQEGEWGLSMVGVGGGLPGGRAPPLGWQGQPAVPLSLCPSKLAACFSQLPRKGNECLGPPGVAPLEQMVPHPWVLGREEAKLANGKLLFRPQESHAHFCPYKCRKLSGSLGPCLPGRGGSWRAQGQRLRVDSQDGMRLGEESRGVLAASFLWVPGRSQGIVPSLAVPFGQNHLAPSPASVLPGP